MKALPLLRGISVLVCTVRKPKEEVGAYHADSGFIAPIDAGGCKDAVANGDHLAMLGRYFYCIALRDLASVQWTTLLRSRLVFHQAPGLFISGSLLDDVVTENSMRFESLLPNDRQDIDWVDHLVCIVPPDQFEPACDAVLRFTRHVQGWNIQAPDFTLRQDTSVLTRGYTFRSDGVTPFIDAR